MTCRIILVHGYTGSPEDLAGIAGRLANRYGSGAVMNVRLPGHGGVALPAFDERKLTAPIEDALDACSREGRPVILLGHSTGGTLILSALAAEGRARPDLVILAAVPKGVDADSLTRWTSHRREKGDISLASVAGMVSLIKRTGSRGPSSSFPVLVLHGGRDELVPQEDASGWTDGFFHGPARKMIVPEAGHQLFRGAGSGLAEDAVLCAVEDAVAVLDETDHAVIGRLTELEPEAKRFLERRPHAARHLARSPSGLSIVQRKLMLSGHAGTEPVLANIEITTRCNLSCPHCARAFRQEPAEDMPLERFRGILDRLPHAYRVTLVGLGEPLLHPRIADLVAEAASRGSRVGMVTNGMLLEPPLSRALVGAGLAAVAFSIDAPNQECAAEVRPGTDLDRMLKNIRSFLEIAGPAGRVTAAVFTAVSARTVPFLEELVDIVAGLGVQVMMMSDLNFEENVAATVWKNAHGDAKEAVRRAISRAFSRKLPVLSVHGLEEFGLGRRYEEFLLVPPGQLYQRSGRRIWCVSPWQTMPVNVRGEVTVCDCQPGKRAGNLFAAPLSEIWNGEVMTEHRRRMLDDARPPGSCRICPRF